MAQQRNWENEYKTSTGTLPWDIGTPAPELVAVAPTLELPTKKVLEIGCGTGTNAIWLAQQGYDVTATEVAPTALNTAKKKARDAKLTINFKLSNICEELPVENHSVGFVFDRGVFHAMPTDARSIFVGHAALALMPGGYWLCLAGSTDETRAEGPPKLSAATIINVAEPLFELHKLERTSFDIPGIGKHLAWAALFRLRPAV